jgi:hypothetical protein
MSIAGYNLLRRYSGEPILDRSRNKSDHYALLYDAISTI